MPSETSDIPGNVDTPSLQSNAEGSALFFHLPPTFRLTELVTFTFYPAFFSVVCSMWISGMAGPIVGVIFGAALSIVAISFRRWGQRWALSHMHERIVQAKNNDLDKAGEIAPHNNFVWLSGAFYLSMEAFVILGIASISAVSIWGGDYDAFVWWYNDVREIIDYAHVFYVGRESEIQAYANTSYADRIPLIKTISTFGLLTCLYAALMSSLHVLVGWGRYWQYLVSVSNQFSLSSQNKLLVSLIIMPAIIMICIYAYFFGGIDYYLIAGKVPKYLSYYYVSAIEVVLTICALWLTAAFQTALIVSYGISIAFNLRCRSIRREGVVHG